MLFRLAIAAMLVYAASLTEVRKDQYVTMVWDGGCLTEVFKTETTKLEAPVDGDGQPIMNKAVVSGLGVRFANNTCGRYVVHKK